MLSLKLEGFVDWQRSQLSILSVHLFFSEKMPKAWDCNNLTVFKLNIPWNFEHRLDKDAFLASSGGFQKSDDSYLFSDQTIDY